uniref:Lipoprotein n=1 Tax=Escherichia coli TaxID=562 RepID=A0A1U9XHM8_ECOLX|nr:hypothetical protein pGD65-4_00029 [Escherichia coli]
MKKYLLFALPFFVVGCSEEVKVWIGGAASYGS